MNIPNSISLFRIALIPVFTALYLKGHTAAAMGVLLLSGASDILDGAIARRYNMVTDLGKILDPLADKLIQTAMMLCAMTVNGAVLWLLVLHLARELILSLMAFQVLRVTGEVHSARWYGKLCTAAIYAAMILILAFPNLDKRYGEAAVFVCFVLVAYCLFMYAGNYIAMLKSKRSKL